MSRKILTFLIFLFLILPVAAEAGRLYTVGFEMMPSGGTYDFDDEAWDTQSGTAADMTVDTTTKRTGLGSLRNTGSGANIDHSFSSLTVATDLYLRFYYRIDDYPSSDKEIARFWDLGVDASEGALVIETDGQLHLTDDEGATDGQGTTVLALNTWYRIEFNYDQGDTMVVLLDGVEEVNSGTHTGDAVDTVAIGGTGASFDEYYDDVAFNDTSAGDGQTSFPGAGSVVYMQPNAAGDANGCSSGDFSSVDEIEPDDPTTLCVLDQANDILDVNVESSSDAGIGASDTITLVHVGEREAGASASTHAWNTRIKSASGGTVTSSGVLNSASASSFTNDDAVPRNYAMKSYTDPTTGVAWTPTGTNSLDNMQIGINATDATPDINLTTLWAVVEFVPALAGGAAPLLQEDGWFTVLD